MQFLTGQPLSAAKAESGGTGYTTGDIVNVTGGTGGQLEASTVIGGHVTGWTVHTPGTGYFHKRIYNVTGGTGTGASFQARCARPNVWGIAAGQGAIEQRGPNGNAVRSRTIQHRTDPPQHYAGPLSIKRGPWTPWIYTQNHLRQLAKYWANTLSGGDRANWDTYAATIGAPWDGFAPGSINGFEAYMAFNKCQGDAYANPEFFFRPAQPPIQPFAPATYVPPPAITPVWDIRAGLPTGTGRFICTFNNTPHTSDAYFHATNPYPPGRIQNATPLVRFYGHYSISVSGGTDERFLSYAVFGPLTAGYKITVGIRLINDDANIEPGPLLIQEVTIT